MDGMGARGNILVIGATNRPNAIDPALRRPGRFDREIEIGVPDKIGRHEILQIHTRAMPLTSDVNLDRLSEISHGYTGADISALCREAAMKSLRRYLPQVNLEDERIPSSSASGLENQRRASARSLGKVAALPHPLFSSTSSTRLLLAEE